MRWGGGHHGRPGGRGGEGGSFSSAGVRVGWDRTDVKVVAAVVVLAVVLVMLR